MCSAVESCLKLHSGDFYSGHMSDLLRQPTVPPGSAGWRGQFWGACPQGRCERRCCSLLFTKLRSPRSEFLLR